MGAFPESQVYRGEVMNYTSCGNPDCRPHPDIETALKEAASALDEILNGEGLLDTDRVDAALLRVRSVIRQEEKCISSSQ